MYTSQGSDAGRFAAQGELSLPVGLQVALVILPPSGVVEALALPSHVVGATGVDD